MKEVRKIADKVILLLMDILVFGYQIVRKVILPTRRRKGNILSSLLSFFVGLVERVLAFEKSILRQPIVFKHKYVKQGLVLAAGFLFLLSSIEWTVGASPAAIVNETQAVATSEPAADAYGAFEARQVKTIDQIPVGSFSVSGFLPYKLPHAFAGEPVAVRRWIRYCIFRI
jgi:hypothetical protein